MRPIRVAVIDYKSGNLRSVSRALEQAGAKPVVTSDPKMILDSDAAILPGVGSGDAAMRALRQRGLVEPLKEFAGTDKPLMGICLGLQLLMDSTEEGDAKCLGIVPGRTRKLSPGLKVPHMGWNQVSFKGTHPVFSGIPDDSHFYFVHSYYADPEDSGLVIGVTEYGMPLCSVVARENLVATQFHPEKSGTLGLKVYDNFVRFVQRTSMDR